MKDRNFVSNGWMYKEVPATAGDLAKFFASMDPDTEVCFDTVYCSDGERNAYIDKDTLEWTKPSDGGVQIDLD